MTDSWTDVPATGASAADPVPAALAAVDELLSDEGWLYASSTSVEEGDPGRFHALFGRDSLISALQLLTRRPAVAAATLRALAERQGLRDDPEVEEQPGKIGHEFRPVAPQWLVDGGWPIRDGALRYYGSSDATSWWLVVLDATADTELQAELRAATLAAGRWLERALAEGNGYVRCGPLRPTGGLGQQGWRDTEDAAADGNGGGIVTEQLTTPAAPLADVDSQAAAVAGLDALARLDPDRREHWMELVTGLRARIAADVTPDVMALDARDEAVTGAGSQLGWLLWADALGPDARDAAVARLTAPDVLTAYGVRTLAETHPAFRPDAYHRGAIWPFDNWIAWGGLRRAGATEAAETVRAGVRRALAELGRYPELYAVRAGRLEPLPVANRIQAWTVGAAVAFDADWDGHRDS